jgi:hypothetical protein
VGVDNAYKSLDEKSSKAPLGRLRHRWKNRIQMAFKKTWCDMGLNYLAQDERMI